jgi:hypothetical protein
VTPALSHFNPVKTSQTSSLKYISLFSSPFTRLFIHVIQLCICVHLLLSLLCYKFFPAHPLWFDHADNILWIVSVMKLLISLCNFYPVLLLPVCRIQILFSALCSQTRKNILWSACSNNTLKPYHGSGGYSPATHRLMPGFVPGSIHVGFPLGQVSDRVLRFSTVSIIPPWLSTHISPGGWTIGPLRGHSSET